MLDLFTQPTYSHVTGECSLLNQTLIACAGSACIAVVCLVIQYLFFYLRKTEDVQQSYAANPIDVVLLGGLRKPLKYLGIKFDRLETPQQEERRWPAAFDQVKLTTWDLNVSSC